MNFNSRDPLNISDVMKDQQLLDFLRKWEFYRRPSSTIRALFKSKMEFLCRLSTANALKWLKYIYSQIFIFDFIFI